MSNGKADHVDFDAACRVADALHLMASLDKEGRSFVVSEALEMKGTTPLPKAFNPYANLESMTARDYFAGQAMPEVIRQTVTEYPPDSKHIDADAPGLCLWTAESHVEGKSWALLIAEASYELADAMLQARSPKEAKEA